MQSVSRRLGRNGVALVALFLVLAAGGAYAASTTTVTASATDTVVHLKANKSLTTQGATQTPILTLRLPAANTRTHYVISAQGDVVNFAASDYTRCGVVVNGRSIATDSTIVGDPTKTGNAGPAGLLATFAMTGGVTVPASGGTATLQCEHDNSKGAAPYVDAGASLWAHRTKSLKTGGE